MDDMLPRVKFLISQHIIIDQSLHSSLTFSQQMHPQLFFLQLLPSHTSAHLTFAVQPTMTARFDDTNPTCTTVGGACSSGTLTSDLSPSNPTPWTPALMEAVVPITAMSPSAP